ncbi:MAG: tRNA lysidine(34) synthetase TilS [Candidatus Omnitrophota bacterium]
MDESTMLLFAFRQKLKDCVERMEMTPPGSRVLIAASGGVDSTVLLDALFHLKEALRIELSVGHVQHGFRGAESEEDERFVFSLAERYDLPFSARRFEPDETKKIRSGNLEGLARDLRYAKLVDMALELECSQIATGHSMTDQAETLLYRLMRSTGYSGLCGVLSVRADLAVPVIRPLLGHTREEILQYAEAAHLPFRQDSSNEDERFARNRIRHSLLPLIREQFNPNIEEALARLAQTAQSEESFWNLHLQRLQKELGGAAPDSPCHRSGFLSLTEAERRRLFRFYCREREIELSYQQTEDALKLLESARPKGEIHLGAGYRLYLRQNEFVISQPCEKTLIKQEYIVNAPGATPIPELQLEILAEIAPSDIIRLKPSHNLWADFDADKIAEPITLRKRREGDRIQPLGLNGSKKVKKILQENRVAIEKRNSIPIVCFGSEIAWVAGCCQSERFRLDEHTKRILRLTLQHME